MMVVQSVRVDQTTFIQSEIYSEEHEYGLWTLGKPDFGSIWLKKERGSARSLGCSKCSTGPKTICWHGNGIIWDHTKRFLKNIHGVWSRLVWKFVTSKTWLLSCVPTAISKPTPRIESPVPKPFVDIQIVSIEITFKGFCTICPELDAGWFGNLLHRCDGIWSGNWNFAFWDEFENWQIVESPHPSNTIKTNEVCPKYTVLNNFECLWSSWAVFSSNSMPSAQPPNTAI